MAFRYSGLNWEGRRWTAPGAIRSFGEQLDREYPTRPRAGDGTVASKTHDAVSPSSDHRPHPTTGPGIVRGLDGSVTTAQGNEITEALRLSRDPRIKYVIWDRRKFSPPSWTWTSYTGANPHSSHFHLSTLAAKDADVSPWQLKGDDDMAVLTDAEQKELQDFLAAIKAAGSNVGFVTQCIEDIRDKNGAGGTYASATHSHGSPGGGLTHADVVAIVNGSQIVAPT